MIISPTDVRNLYKSENSILFNIIFDLLAANSLYVYKYTLFHF
jgi:hypothetical protein